MTPSHAKLSPMAEVMASSAYRIRSMVDGLDQVALSMERKWGVGRLRLLVSDFLRAKFDEQKDRLNDALRSCDERFVSIQVEGMRRAWTALDRAAHEAGASPLAPQVWECVLPSTGEIISLVRSEDEAHHIVREGRVFTVAEVAILIDALSDGVLTIKQKFPGAAVIGIRRRAPVDWERGDDIPYDETVRHTFGCDPTDCRHRIAHDPLTRSWDHHGMGDAARWRRDPERDDFIQAESLRRRRHALSALSWLAREYRRRCTRG